MALRSYFLVPILLTFVACSNGASRGTPSIVNNSHAATASRATSASRAAANNVSIPNHFAQARGYDLRDADIDS